MSPFGRAQPLVDGQRVGVDPGGVICTTEIVVRLVVDVE
jgi:hypothetical protein